MTGSEFPIILAVAVALAVWGLAQVVAYAHRGENRKIRNRLRNDVAPEQNSQSTLRVLLQSEDANLPALLRKVAFFQRLNKKLAIAFADTKLSRFMMLCGGIATFAFMMVAAVMDSAGAGMIAGAMAGYVPILVVNSRGARRQKQIANQLPDALDFLSRILRAGHSFSTGLQMMGEELPAPLAVEFRRCYAQHGLGQALEDSLRDMAARIESSDFAFFVTAVLIQRQTGGDLSEVLSNISSMVRQRIRLQQHVRAVTAEGRLTSYILVAFPMVLFGISYALNPDYAGLLLRTGTGRMMLGGALLLQMMGLVVIRRIVTVRV